MVFLIGSLRRTLHHIQMFCSGSPLDSYSVASTQCCHKNVVTLPLHYITQVFNLHLNLKINLFADYLSSYYESQARDLHSISAFKISSYYLIKVCGVFLRFFCFFLLGCLWQTQSRSAFCLFVFFFFFFFPCR